MTSEATVSHVKTAALDTTGEELSGLGASDSLAYLTYLEIKEVGGVNPILVSLDNKSTFAITIAASTSKVIKPATGTMVQAGATGMQLWWKGSGGNANAEAVFETRSI